MTRISPGIETNNSRAESIGNPHDSIAKGAGVVAQAPDTPRRSVSALDERIRALGLRGRMLGAGLILVALVAAAFATLLIAVVNLRDATDAAQRADRVAAVANDLQRLTIDLETGPRGFVITGQDAFLQPWSAARDAIPPKERELVGLVDGARRARAEEIVRAVEHYRTDWSIPTVAVAQADLPAAIAEIAAGAGKREIDHIRVLFRGFLAENSRISGRQQQRAASAGDRAVLFGAIGLGGSVLLVLLFGAFLERGVVAPVRELARATALVGEGDLAVRVPETGPGEIGELAATFNAMARSLETTRSELQRQNAELDSFSYSVSHDLRAPLRAVDGFSRLLVEEHAAELPPEAARYLGLVRKNTQDMGALIDGLLQFSRLGQQQLATRRVDMTALARECAAELEASLSGRQVEIVVSELPAARADPTLVRQVLANLLSNAVKYTREQEAARIEVGAGTGDDGIPAYFVRDNGVGFDMRYVDKLFKVFQRLHRAEDYEGTGVGLALVARIVHRHGGRIWAEGAPDEGATFTFTLQGGET
jgi:signal transduction histidine kinase